MPARLTAHSLFPTPEPQNDLEYAVYRRLAQVGPENFFFVEVGAFDGVTNDPVYPFVKVYHWRGLLVEPQKEMFAALQQNYAGEPQLTFVNAAIAKMDGRCDFYQVRGDVSGLPAWSKQIASLHREHLLKHENGVPAIGITETIPGIAELVVAEPVECLTLNTLLERYRVQSVDLLHIDAESCDYEILSGLDFDRVRPAVIHFEHMHLKPEEKTAAERLLSTHGYRVITGFTDVVAFLE